MNTYFKPDIFKNYLFNFETAFNCLQNTECKMCNMFVIKNYYQNILFYGQYTDFLF